MGNVIQPEPKEIIKSSVRFLTKRNKFMKTIVSLLFVLIFSFVAFGQIKKTDASKPTKKHLLTQVRKESVTEIKNVEVNSLDEANSNTDKWIYFAKSKVGTFYFNPAKVKKSDGKLSYWEKIIPANPADYARNNQLRKTDVSHSLSYVAVNCQDSSSQIQYIVFYASDGTVIEDGVTLGISETILAIPDSVAEMALKKVCAIK